MFEYPINNIQTVAEKIKQRRSQVLVHSCIYYRMGSHVVSDEQWQKWANDLRDTQNLFGYQIGFYDEVFKDWDGSTGYHLPLSDPWVVHRAQQLLNQFSDNAHGC